MIDKKKLIIALIVFIASFLVARSFFANWDKIKEFVF